MKELRYPWIEIERSQSFDEQLFRELPPGHILLGIAVRAIARVDGDDDVLYELLDGTNRVAVVHLTFAQNIDSNWPWTELYSSYSSWASDRMQRDAGGPGV